MKELWLRFQMLRGYFRMVRYPEQTELIFEGIKLIKKLRDQSGVRAVIAQIKTHPEFVAMMESGYMPTKPDLKYLATLPEGTFGREVYNHMAKNHISFDLFPEEQPTSEIDYLTQRMYLDHDLWHVLLNLNTDVSDEISLQALNVAQLRSPFAAFIISGGILHLLRKEPLRAADAVRKISEIYRKGCNAKFLLGIKLHEMFERPLTEVRAVAGL